MQEPREPQLGVGRRERAHPLVGLVRGEQVCVSNLPGAVDGMAVRVAAPETAIAGPTP